MLPRKQIEDAGMIHLCPYIYVFGTFAKKRWYDRSLLKVLCEEFVEYDEDYYISAAESGQILVLRRGAIYCFVKSAQPSTLLHPTAEPSLKSGRGGQNSAYTPKTQKQTLYVEYSIKDFTLRDSDLILHVMHRHEPPILARPLLHNRDASAAATTAMATADGGSSVKYVFCEKPASMPVHPCGRYCYHSVNELVAGAPGTKDKQSLRACNRIDKLVSGLIVMATSADDAERKRREIVERENVKVYLANSRITDARVAAGDLCIVWAPMGLKFKNNYTSRRIHFDTHAELFGANIERLDKYNACVERLRNACKQADKDAVLMETKNMLWFRGSDAYKKFTTNKANLDILRELVAVQLEPTQSMSDIGEHQAALTLLKYIHVDAKKNTVLVMCVPITGRTHQLRLHLQAVGTPIHNDPSHGGLRENLAVRCTLPSPEVLKKMLAYEPLSMRAYTSKVLERIRAQKSLQSLDLTKIEPALNEVSRAVAESQSGNPCRICAELSQATERTLSPVEVTCYDEARESYNIKYEHIKTYMFTHIDLHSYYYESGADAICTAPPAFATDHGLDADDLAPHLKGIALIKKTLMACPASK